MKKVFAYVGGALVPVFVGVGSALAAGGTDYSTGVAVDTTTLGGSATTLITALAILAGIGMALKLWRGRA